MNRGHPSRLRRASMDIEEEIRREQAIRQYELTKARGEQWYRSRLDGTLKRHVQERDQIMRDHAALRTNEEVRIQADIAERLALERRQLQHAANAQYEDLVRSLRETHKREDEARKEVLEDRRRFVTQQSALMNTLRDAEYQQQRSTLERSLLPLIPAHPHNTTMASTSSSSIIANNGPRLLPAPVAVQEPQPRPPSLPSTLLPAPPSLSPPWDQYFIIPLTLGRLIHLKTSFARFDIDGKGSLNMEQLGEWARHTSGGESMTFGHLKRMMEQVDLDRTGRVDFWSFLAMQVYISLPPDTRQRLDLPQWIRFCTQKGTRKGPFQSQPPRNGVNPMASLPAPAPPPVPEIDDYPPHHFSSSLAQPISLFPAMTSAVPDTEPALMMPAVPMPQFM